MNGHAWRVQEVQPRSPRGPRQLPAVPPEVFYGREDGINLMALRIQQRHWVHKLCQIDCKEGGVGRGRCLASCCICMVIAQGLRMSEPDAQLVVRLDLFQHRSCGTGRCQCQHPAHLPTVGALKLTSNRPILPALQHLKGGQGVREDLGSLQPHCQPQCDQLTMSTAPRLWKLHLGDGVKVRDDHGSATSPHHRPIRIGGILQGKGVLRHEGDQSRVAALRVNQWPSCRPPAGQIPPCLPTHSAESSSQGSRRLLPKRLCAQHRPMHQPNHRGQVGQLVQPPKLPHSHLHQGVPDGMESKRGTHHHFWRPPTVEMQWGLGDHCGLTSGRQRHQHLRGQVAHLAAV